MSDAIQNYCKEKILNSKYPQETIKASPPPISEPDKRYQYDTRHEWLSDFFKNSQKRWFRKLKEEQQIKENAILEMNIILEDKSK